MLDMAILRAKDIRKLSEKDLDKKLNELRLEFAKEKANVSVGGTVSSPGRLKEIRKTITRIETIKAEDSTKGGIRKK